MINWLGLTFPEVISVKYYLIYAIFLVIPLTPLIFYSALAVNDYVSILLISLNNCSTQISSGSNA